MAKSQLTLEILQKRLDALVSFYKDRNSNILKWRDIYFRVEGMYFAGDDGKLKEKEPDEYRIVMPVAKTTVDAFIELILTKPPTLHVPRTEVKPELNDVADQNEKILYATWERGRVNRRAIDSLWFGLVDGWGVFQIAWDKHADTDVGECPIVVVTHDPYNIYAMPGAKPDTWRYIINAYPRLVGAIRDEFGLYDDQLDMRKKRDKELKALFKDLKDDDTVTYIDYWDKDVNAIAVSFQAKDKNRGDTKAVVWLKSPKDHGYGFLPWVIYHPCSLPFPHVGARIGISILYDVQDLAIYFSQLISKRATFLERHFDPPLVTKTEDGRAYQPIRTASGDHYRLELEESAEYLVNPGLHNPAAIAQIELVMSMIERCTLPRVLQGQYVGSISGIAMSLLRNPTLMKVAFKQEALENALVKVNEYILRLYEIFLRKSLYLWGKGIGGKSLDIEISGDEIKGYYRNEVKLSASLPTDDANTVNMVVAMVQQKLISRQTALDILQQMLHDLLPQSVQDEAKRVIAEAILDNPMIIQGLAMQAAKQGGLPISLEAPEGENARGGYGEREVTMPPGTLPPQLGALAGGNTQPSMEQRMAEIQTSAGIPGRVEEKVE